MRDIASVGLAFIQCTPRAGRQNSQRIAPPSLECVVHTTGAEFHAKTAPVKPVIPALACHLLIFSFSFSSTAVERCIRLYPRMNPVLCAPNEPGEDPCCLFTLFHSQLQCSWCRIKETSTTCSSEGRAGAPRTPYCTAPGREHYYPACSAKGLTWQECAAAPPGTPLPSRHSVQAVRSALSQSVPWYPFAHKPDLPMVVKQVVFGEQVACSLSSARDHRGGQLTSRSQISCPKQQSLTGNSIA